MIPLNPAYWQSPERKAAWDALMAWLKAIMAGEKAVPVFILSGDKGVGKTMLLEWLQKTGAEKRTARIASCEICDGTCFRRVVNSQTDRRIYVPCDCAKRGRVEFVSVHTPLRRGGTLGLQELLMRESFGGDEGKEARERLLSLCDAGLLLVDELGAEREKPETWIPGLQRVLDARQDRHTLFATNLDDKGIINLYRDPRIIDRLLGKSVSIYQRVNAESFRNQEATA